ESEKLQNSTCWEGFMDHLFPKEIIESTQEHNFSKHSTQSKLIYSMIVLALIAAFSALPFIYTDVGVRGQGMIRPVTEVVKIASPVSARITSLRAAENSRIQQGDIIATLDDEDIRQQQLFIKSRVEELRKLISDVTLLTDSATYPEVSSQNLLTLRFKREIQEFEQQFINHQQLIDRQMRLLSREEELFNRDAISLASLEERQNSLQIEENKLKLFLEQKRNSWNQEKERYKRELDEAKTELHQLLNEQRRYIIRSPVTGTIQNINGILENSFLFTNQAIGEISPDTSLIAEVYVPPREIGLLREGMQVRIQIDAFDHNQWGTATGEIESISTDMIITENTPMFKVRCSINQTFLELPNGFRGILKKGMTLQARFIINRRSLFQLLYDNVDDWLNPSWSVAEENKTSNHS
ncbi:MAG: HlyD family secretion protein, partial [Bacteroidota bacterium]